MTNSLKNEEEGSPKKGNAERGKADSWSQSSIDRRSGFDRRSGMDRRKMHDLNRHIGNNYETQRRSIKERRERDELRRDWARFSKWSSMYVGGSNLKGAKVTDPFRNVAKGDVIYREGDEADYLYVISEGRVEITRGMDDKGFIASELGKGEFFGEMCILLSRRRTATAVAKEDTILMIYTADELENLIATRPNIVIRIIEKLVKRLNKTTKDLKVATEELAGK